MRNGFGLILILFGAIALISNFYAFNLNDIWPYLWPALLIVLGLSTWIKNRQSRLVSLIMLLVGGLYFLRAMRILVVSDERMWAYIWPSIIILIGLQVLLQRESRPARRKASKTPDQSGPIENQDDANHRPGSNQKTYSVLLGAIEERIENRAFESCAINCILGAADMDMRDIEFEGVATLEINVIMGAVECILPSNLKLVINGTPIAGSFDNRCISDENSSRQLNISYTVLFGGIEITQK
jgi:predicted membrane protein